MFFVKRLLNEVNECLRPHEFLKERLVLPHVLYILLEVKDVVGRPSQCLRTPGAVNSGRSSSLTAYRLMDGGSFLVFSLYVEVFKSVYEEDEEVEELLLDFESEVVPKPIFILDLIFVLLPSLGEFLAFF